MKVFGFLLGFFGVVAAAAADSDKADSSVVQLTSDNFDDFLKDNKVSLVKFYAPWCGHCKTLAPEYEAAAKELKKTGGIPLGEVDATQEKSLAEKYEIRGFPTMIVFRNGNPQPYNGGRTKATILEYVQKMTGPAVTWAANKAEAEKLAKEGSVSFVAALPSKTDKAFETYEKVADDYRMKGRFIAYEDSKATGTVEVHRQAEDVSSTPIEEQAKLEKWIEAESVPLLGPINADTYPMYASRNTDWVWFAASPDDYQRLGTPLRKVSKNFRDEFNFVWLNIDELKAHAENALGITSFPGVVVVRGDKKYKYEDEITNKNLSKFMQSVIDGKVAPFLKSEPIPEENDGPVKIVVGKEFSKLVLEGDKDVFLKIYAPWCGHCTKLAPVWEELGVAMGDNKNFMVAKFDGTANEPDVDGFAFRGFPTIYFVPAGQKTPIAYDGGRTLDDFISFAKKHAKHPITAVDAGSEEKDEL